MNFVLRPWQLLLLILAGWINRDQQDAIEYLLTENQVLAEKSSASAAFCSTTTSVDAGPSRARCWAEKTSANWPRSSGPTRFCAGIESLSLQVGSLRQEAIRWPTTHSTTDCGLGSAHGSGES